jgi:hypothetical protein
MHQLKTAYRDYFNRRHQVVGHLFSGQIQEKHFQFDLEALEERGIRNNLGRRCAITLSWDHAGLSHDEIAALFRMPSYGAC